MKKIFLTSVLALASVAAFASGILGTDQPQQGILTAAIGGPFLLTNNFNPPFSVTPVVIITPITTNAYPFTNTVITTTNMIVAVGNTNSQIAFSAFIGYPLMQIGTNASSGLALVTNTFTIPYATAPVISLTSSLLSTNSAVVSAIMGTNSPNSITGFVINLGVPTNQPVYWQAIGQAYRPGTRTVTY